MFRMFFPDAGGPLPFPLAELVLRGSELVPDFRVLRVKFDVAANLSFALSEGVIFDETKRKRMCVLLLQDLLQSCSCVGPVRNPVL